MGSRFSPGFTHPFLLPRDPGLPGGTGQSVRPSRFFLFLIFKIFIYLFLAALGLRCCVRAFSSCGEWGLLFVVVHGLPIAVASLVAEVGL